MKIKHLGILLIICSFVGAFVCAYHHGWLVVWLPSKDKTSGDYTTRATSTRKKITLTWWNNNRWHTESTEIVWPTDTAQALEALVHQWLAYMKEENLCSAKVDLQTALLSSSGTTAYLSFDRNPIDKNAPIFDKIIWFEGLLSTIKKNGLPCTHVQFLVAHQPLSDPHLDCSMPWPITGFLQKS